MEDKKELERLKKVLLTNLTNQIQLLLDFKSRTVDEKVKNIITQRIAKVNAEMKQVNALKDVDEINSKYGEDMLGPLDVTLRVQQGTCKDELKMDYNNCSKLFMEYGKINQMTISEDGKSVLVRYFSLSGAAKAFDALKSIGYDISFISHVFQHLAEAKAAKEPEAEPIATETG